MTNNLCNKMHAIKLKSLLIHKLPIGIGSKQIGSDLWQRLLGNHGQSGFQCVVHFDFALLCIQLHSTGTKLKKLLFSIRYEVT